jgi:thiol-disulfide isomerase/thioredoxin
MLPQRTTPRLAIAAVFFAMLAGCAESAPPPANPSRPGEAGPGPEHATTDPSAKTRRSTPSRTPAQVEQGFQAVLASLDLDGQPVGQAPDKQVTALVVFASWCGACRAELAILGELRDEEPRLRVIGINYLAHEEYADRSDDAALRAFLADNAPWLQVVRADDALMNALGKPRKVPTLFLFDSRGRLVRAYLRARRRPPTKDELRASILAVMSSPGAGQGPSQGPANTQSKGIDR